MGGWLPFFLESYVGNGWKIIAAPREFGWMAMSAVRVLRYHEMYVGFVS